VANDDTKMPGGKMVEPPKGRRKAGEMPHGDMHRPAEAAKPAKKPAARKAAAAAKKPAAKAAGAAKTTATAAKRTATPAKKPAARKKGGAK
jgi:hypothetical protein